MAAAKEGGDDAGNVILLISSDGEQFEVPEAAASLSRIVSHMIEDGCTENGVRLHNVACSVLVKIIEYCNKHAAAAMETAEDLESFDAEFFDVDKTMLFDLIMAANYMDIKRLLYLATQHVADVIKGKSVDEIRKEFGIRNDYMPEE
ncbi:SKP1-like protein 5 [Oryza brachyantha]|uniref:SKP1-like protein 5 n=1 Tax=Oryza brachyantha TaxID=4533 RepID=UPI001AD95259|nr:SKP1-like protein 5 [Oryza brachyantha]